MKRNWKPILWRILTVGSILILVPVIIQLFIYWYTGNRGSSEGWLGFWGNYLGALIGLLGIFLILKNQFQKEHLARQKDKVDNTFFNLLQLHNEQREKINQASFKKIHTHLIEESHKKVIALEHQFIIENTDRLLQILLALNAAYNKFAFNNKEGFTEEIEGQMASIDTLVNLLKKNQHLNRLLQNNVYNSVRNIYERADVLKIGDLETLTTYKDELVAFRNDHEFTQLDKNEIIHLVESTITTHYYEIGAYLRFFHIVVKYINDKTTNDTEKEEYIAFLRASLNEIEMLIFFYIAVYTERGLELLEEFSKTDFFGAPHEFSLNNEPPYINKESLIWTRSDVEIMKNLPAAFQQRKKTGN